MRGWLLLGFLVFALLGTQSALAARFTAVRVLDAAPDATGAVPTLELELPPVPGPHTVLLQLRRDGADRPAAETGASPWPAWLHARASLRQATAAPDLAATLDFLARQISAWGGDGRQIVLALDAADWPLLAPAFAVTRTRPAGVIVTLSEAVARAAPAPREPVPPLLVLFDPAAAAARRDALRLGAEWRWAGNRADVLPLATSATAAERAQLVAAWTAALEIPRLARWEALRIESELPGPQPSMPAGAPVALLAQSGRLALYTAEHGVALWTRTGTGVWTRSQHWPEASALAWAADAAAERAPGHAVLVIAGRAVLWQHDAGGSWRAVAQADSAWPLDGRSRVVAVPEQQLVLWFVDDEDGGTAVYELVAAGDGPPLRRARQQLPGRLVDALRFDGQVVVATRALGAVALWSLDARAQRWAPRAQFDAETTALALADAGATLLAFGSRRIERLAARDAFAQSELELAAALGAMLSVPAETALRDVAPQVARLPHPETGEVALALGLEVADPDPRASPARFLVRDAEGRYAIGEVGDAAGTQASWPRVIVQDPDPDASHVVHLLPASNAMPMAAALADPQPRRGLWRAYRDEAWLGLERLAGGWAAVLVLPHPSGPRAWLASGRIVASGASAEAAAASPKALDWHFIPAGLGASAFDDRSAVEPISIVFGASARAACARDGVDAAAARVSLGAGERARYHCFMRPAGSALPLGLNGLWGDATAESRWIALVEASAHRGSVGAEALVLLRDQAGATRVLRGAGPAQATLLDLPLYATCPGCGGPPLGNLRLAVDGPCGAQTAALGFVAQLPDDAGFHQRAYGAIDRLAGGACY